MTQHNTFFQQFDHKQFITDGGLETTLVFENGIDLPEFAAFPLIFTVEGRETLKNYYVQYLTIARKRHFGFILESPTWRASKNWGEKLGFSSDQLVLANHKSIEFLKDLRSTFEDTDHPAIISGCIGPYGDGYHIDTKLSVSEALEYHSEQIKNLAEAGADIVSAFTLNYVEEAIGIVLAAQECHIPVVISFTVETDGRLPSGQPLGSAIEEVDLATNNCAAYFMINCAHPSHFEKNLRPDEQWTRRIYAIRANASSKSHEELDQADELDQGNPQEFGKEYSRLSQLLPNLRVFGGCCGTDHHHIEAICDSIGKTAFA